MARALVLPETVLSTCPRLQEVLPVSDRPVTAEQSDAATVHALSYARLKVLIVL